MIEGVPHETIKELEVGVVSNSQMHAYLSVALPPNFLENLVGDNPAPFSMMILSEVIIVLLSNPVRTCCVSGIMDSQIGEH